MSTRTADLTRSADLTRPDFTTLDLTGSIKMNLMQEDLARAHMDARLSQARELRLSRSLSRSRRLARRAERATQQARLRLARSL